MSTRSLISQPFTKLPWVGLSGWWLQYFRGIFLMLIAMAAWDLWRRRRIHPAVLRLVNAWGRLFGSA